MFKYYLFPLSFVLIYVSSKTLGGTVSQGNREAAFITYSCTCTEHPSKWPENIQHVICCVIIVCLVLYIIKQYT